MSGIFGNAPARRLGVLGGVQGLGEMSASLAAQYADAMKQCANKRLVDAGYLAVDYGPPGPQTCWLVNTKYSDGCQGKSQVLQYCIDKKIAGSAPGMAPKGTTVTAMLTTAQEAGAKILADTIGGAKVAYPWGSVSEGTRQLQREVNAFGKKMVDTGVWQTFCQVAEDGKLGPGTCGALRAAYGQNAIPNTCKEVATDCRGTKVGKGGSVTPAKTGPVVTAPPSPLPQVLPSDESWLDRIGGIGTLIMGGAVVAALGIVGTAVAKKKGLIGKKKVKSNRRSRPRRNGRLVDAIRFGDRVTIVTPHGQQRTGRAVMRGDYGWVLNLGGRYGTPGIATDENTVKVVPARARRSK